MRIVSPTGHHTRERGTMRALIRGHRATNRVTSIGLAVIALTAIASVTACSSAESTPTTTTLNGGALVGHWTSAECEPSPQPDGTTTYLRRDPTFTATTATVRVHAFGDPACTAPLFSARIEGSFHIGASMAASKANQFDFTFAALYMTPENPGLVAAFQNGKCGTET